MGRFGTGYRSNKGLWLALAAAGLITAVYAYVIDRTREVPATGALFGHLLGILGFVLMLLTETLYSIWKSRQTGVWEARAAWLQFHFFTGLVGPYLVFLHGSWKFYGLAGATLLLTFIVVVSGLIGRYIYSRVSRLPVGIEMEGVSGGSQAADLRRGSRLLAAWHLIHISLGMALFTAAFVHIGAVLYFMVSRR